MFFRTVSDHSSIRKPRSKTLPFAIGVLQAAFLYLLFQYGTCEAFDTNSLIQTLSNACPYSRFCTRSPSKQFGYEGRMPCCKPCSCDQDCWMRDNCCPDQENRTDLPPPNQECISPFIFKSVLSAKTFDGRKDGINFYYGINKCPAEYKNIDTVLNCKQPPFNDFHNAVAVSDKSGRMFKNRYCAECNGVKEYIPWTLELVCIGDTISLDSGIVGLNLASLTNNFCHVYSKPPSEIIDTTFRCFHGIFDRCNVTGQWKTYDRQIELGCAWGTYLYYLQYMSGGVEIFKNPFCYMCNFDVNKHDVKSKMRDVCISDANEESRNVLFLSFTVTFDFVGIISDAPDTEQTRAAACGKMEISDPYFVSMGLV